MRPTSSCASYRDLLALLESHCSRERAQSPARHSRHCRSAALGGRVQQCDRCGHRVDLGYNSCRNRHCPKCQAQARARWLTQRESELRPCSFPRRIHAAFRRSDAWHFRTRNGNLQHPDSMHGRGHVARKQPPIPDCSAPTSALPSPVRAASPLGPESASASAPALRRARRWHLARWLALDRDLPQVLFLSTGTRVLSHRFRKSFLRALPPRIPQRLSSLPRRDDVVVGNPPPSQALCDHAAAIDWDGARQSHHFMGGPPRAEVPGSLYSPRRHLQPSPARARKRPRQL